MNRVLITGGAGHIGQNLVKRLLADGVAVTVFDNLSSGRRKDMDPFLGSPGFRFIFGDVRELPALIRSMPGHDVVFHLAANGDIPRGRTDPACDFENNTVGTRNVLEAMRATGVPKILFSSTAAAYGDGSANRVPLVETYGPLLPISLYAASKIAGETMISAYCHLFGIEAWIFRFANVVGGGMNHGVCYDLITKLRANPNELEVWGDGKGEKPYFLVDDCIRGMLVAYYAERFRNCDIYNLGTNTFATVEQVAQTVIEEMGLKDVKIKYTGGARGFPGDVPIVRYSAERMNAYGWEASHTSVEAVRIAVRKLIAGVL